LKLETDGLKENRICPIIEKLSRGSEQQDSPTPWQKAGQEKGVDKREFTKIHARQDSFLGKIRDDYP